MTRRKQEHPVVETQPSQSDAGEMQPETQTARHEAEIETLRSELTQAQVKAQEYLEALQRERADFVNYRRRVEQEKEQMGQWVAGETIKKLLPVLDDLELALANRPADEPWANGVELVYRKFQSILEKEGLFAWKPKGNRLTPICTRLLCKKLARHMNLAQ